MRSFISILILFTLIGCRSYRSTKPTYSYIPISMTHGINKNEISNVSKRKYFDNYSYFGKQRDGYLISYTHAIYRPVQCTSGIIVELASCHEGLSCDTQLSWFNLTQEETDNLFYDSTSKFIDSITTGAHIRKVTIQKECQILLIEEIDTVQKIITNILIQSSDCLITETKVTNKQILPKQSSTSQANLSKSDLLKFTKPIHFVWETYSNPNQGTIFRRVEARVVSSCR